MHVQLCALIAEKMKIEEAAAYSLYEVEEGQGDPTPVPHFDHARSL
jgi:hypothetical protein